MKKYHRIMEIFWLVATIFTLLFAVYVIGKLGFKEGYLYLFMPLVAAMLYGMRRYMRKKMEKNSPPHN